MSSLGKRPRYQYLRFLQFAMLSLLPLILLCVLVMQKSQTWAQYIARQNAADLLEKNVALIERDFSNLSISITLFDSDEDLHHLLADLDYGKPLEILRAQRQYASICNRYFFDVSDIVSIDMITPERTFSFIDKFAMPKENFTQSPHYLSLLGSDGHLRWFPTYDMAKAFGAEVYARGREFRVFSIAMQMQLTYHRNDNQYVFPADAVRPVLFVNLTDHYFDKILSSDHLISETAHAVYDRATGELIYATQEPLAVALDDIPQAAPSQISRHELPGADGQRYLVTARALSSGPSWVVASFTPVAAANAFFGDSLWVIMVIVLTLTTLYTMLMVFLSTRSLSRPLSTLEQAIARTAAGDFQTRIPDSTPSDFQAIFDQFNDMNQNITQLIHENYEIKLNEKNLEIQVINLQFNPHFMYNTLNLISLMAIARGEAQISDMVHSLALMMRYSVKVPQGLVPFREDLKYIDAYVSLMQLRFDERFVYEKDVDEKILDYHVPKFLLQPFIENAILHGFAEKDRLFRLSIRGLIEGDSITFYVEDNGRGISQEEIDAIWNQDSTALGIRNTHLRIQLYYGEDHGVKILPSSLGQGTQIIVRVRTLR